MAAGTVQPEYGELLAVIVVATGQHDVPAAVVGQACDQNWLLYPEPGIDDDLGEAGLGGPSGDRDRNYQAEEDISHGRQYTSRSLCLRYRVRSGPISFP